MTYSAFDFEVFGKARTLDLGMTLRPGAMPLSSPLLFVLQVQGVFFRATTIEQAKKLGLVGHVENTSSGTVTGEAQGQKQPVSQLKVSNLVIVVHAYAVVHFCC